MNLDGFYELTTDAVQRAAELRLTRVKWSVFAAISKGQLATARGIAERIGVDPAAMSSILEELQAQGLVHEPEMTHSEYLDRCGDCERNKAISEPERNSEPVEALPEKAELRSASTVASERKVSFTLRKSESRSPRQTQPSVEPWPIKPLLDLVRERAGDDSLGQLAIYRMFLKVPPELIESSGLEQLDLDKADIQISEPALAAALRRSASEVLGIGETELNELLKA